jgi:hypothetical protein
LREEGPLHCRTAEHLSAREALDRVATLWLLASPQGLGVDTATSLFSELQEKRA